MTQVDQVVGTGSGPHHLRALSRLVAHPESFGPDVWGRRALLTRAAELSAPFGDLLTQSDVDALVSTHGMRTPFLRVARAGSTLPERDFTAGGGVGAAVADQVSDDKLTRLFADGATMVLQALHRTHPPVLAFSQRLAAELGHPVQANAYVTPPQNQGFSDHYDVHDVFVLQTHGRKRWVIHDPVHPAPLRDQPWTDRRADVEAAAATEPRIDAVLEPGDCLYLPRGYLHAATALGEVSTHLTVGVHTWTGYGVADTLVRAALSRLADDLTVRGSLPLGVDVGSAEHLCDTVNRMRDRLCEALRDLDASDVAAALDRRAAAAQRAAPVGPLAQLAAAQQLDGADVVTLREHLRARLDDCGGRTVLRSRAGDVTVEADDEPALRRLLQAGRARVEELGPRGVELARLLLRHGVVVVE